MTAGDQGRDEDKGEEKKMKETIMAAVRDSLVVVTAALQMLLHEGEVGLGCEQTVAARLMHGAYTVHLGEKRGEEERKEEEEERREDRKSG